MINSAIERMNELAASGETEGGHTQADALLCELVEAAYGPKGKELTAIFDEMDKWYS